MYTLQRKSTEWAIRTRRREERLTFSWELSQCYKGTQKRTCYWKVQRQKCTRTRATQMEGGMAMEAADRHSRMKSCLTWAQWWGTWGSQQRNASMLLCKVPSARPRGMRQKMRIAGDGNCRNGYHKVKCQVPDTEELHRRERGGENKHNRAKLQRDYVKLTTLTWTSGNWWFATKMREGSPATTDIVKWGNLFLMWMKSKNKRQQGRTSRVTHSS